MKKILKNILGFLLIYNVTVFAAGINDMVNTALKRQQQIMSEKSSQPGLDKIAVSKKVETYQNIIEELKNSAQKNSKAHFVKPAPKAIVFVSFSMPKLALQEVVQDANYYQIPVVLRGLYNNSFQDTARKLFELVKDKKSGGVLIDPLWFKHFAIQSVPAVVLTSGNKFDVVYGNIPLKRALTIIADRGDIAAVAKNILGEDGHE